MTSGPDNEEDNINVLIIDDEEIIPRVLKDFLEDESGFNVFAALSAEEAIKMLDSVTPGVCIVDMRLPGMNGTEFILETQKRLGQCAYIIHTGSLEYTLSPELREIGITDEFVLKKPVVNLALFKDKILKLTKN